MFTHLIFSLLLYVQSLPKLEGLIHLLPEKVYAGELRHLTLELSNKSEVAVKV